VAKINEEKQQEARDLYATRKYSIADISRILKVSPVTVGLYLHPERREKYNEYWAKNKK